MLVKKIDKDSTVNGNERRQKAYNMLRNIYESGHNYFSIEEFEGEYNTVASLRNYLNDEAYKISVEVLKELGFSSKEIRILRLECRKLMSIFVIRKVSCKPVLVVEVKRYSDMVLSNFRKIIAEKKHA